MQTPQVPLQVPAVPTTPTPFGQEQVSATTEHTELTTDAQYAGQAFNVPSLSKGCSRSWGDMNATRSSYAPLNAAGFAVTARTTNVLPVLSALVISPSPASSVEIRVAVLDVLAPKPFAPWDTIATAPVVVTLTSAVLAALSS